MAKKKKYSLGDKYNYHYRRVYAPKTLKSRPSLYQQAYSSGFTDACYGIDNRDCVRETEGRGTFASYASGRRNALRAIKKSGIEGKKRERMFKHIRRNISEK